MQRGTICILMGIILALSSLSLIVGANAEDQMESISNPLATKEWTIMVYVDADNDLEYQGINDFLEMSEVGSDTNINIVVQLDRIGWSDLYDHYIVLGYSSSEATARANAYDDDRYGDWETCKRFYVETDDTPIAANALSDLGEADMGNPNTLYNFINWSIQNYPAKRYGVVLWDHGGQWYGVCSDDTSGNSILNMSELDLVFWNLQNRESFHMDFLGFDACMMGSAEVAYQMWGYTDYMIGSELNEPGNGWIYNWSLQYLSDNPLIHTEEFCRTIVDDYVESYETIYSSYQDDVTLSVVNYTADFYSGIYSVYNFTYELYTNYSLYQNYINYAWGLRENYSEDYCDMLDLFSMIYYETDYSVLNDLYYRMIQNLTGVYCYQNISDGDNDGYPYWATGLSIYFPTYLNYDVEYTKDPYFYFPQDTYWPDFLYEVYLQPTNTDPVISVNYPKSPTVSIYETQSVEFNISASDKEGNHLRYFWFIDDDLVSEGKVLNISTDFGSAGKYSVDCIVMDGAIEGLMYGMTGYDIESWNLDILVDEENPVISDPIIPTKFPSKAWIGFRVNVTDNVEVDEVRFISDVFMDQGTYNHSMSFEEGSTYEILIYNPGDYIPEQYSDPGWHNLTFAASDTAGNWAVLEDVPFYLTDIFDPVADPGEDIEIDQHTLFGFDGSGSSDNWMIVNYTWTFDYAGEEIVLYGSNPGFLFDDVGIYAVNLTVTDPDDNFGFNIITITVLDVDVPSIELGEDIEIDQHEVVQLNGENNDDNVGVVNWTWTFEYNDISYTLYGENQEFTFDIVGIYNLTVSVKDEAGNSASDYFLVAVIDITDPVPVLSEEINIDQNTEYSFDPSGSQDNVGITNYTWTFTYDGNVITLYGPNPTFVFGIPGSYLVTLTITDLVGNTATATQTIIVKDIEDPIAFIAFTQDDPYPAVIHFDGSGSTDNVGIATYNWTITFGTEVVYLTGESIDYDFRSSGNYSIELEVIDEEGNLGSYMVYVEIEELPDDDTPGDDTPDDDVPDDDTPDDDTPDDDTPDDDTPDDDTPDDDTPDDDITDDDTPDDSTSKDSNFLIPVVISLFVVIFLIIAGVVAFLIIRKKDQGEEDKSEGSDVSDPDMNADDNLLGDETG